jgi:hypothetical protein
MTWLDPHTDDFATRWYDDLDAEDDLACALADRIADHTPVFTAPEPEAPRGEAWPLTTAMRDPDAFPARRGRSTSTGIAP